jgi:acetylornithine deacetylase/succinyl-diaminopimelate desuccinylase-like protein
MDRILGYIENNKERYLNELKELLSIPSISTDDGHNPDVQKCARWIADHLAGVGMKNTQIFQTKGHPIVYSEWLEAPGAPTVLFYGHYDVQPVDPIELWTSPPFQPTVRGDNIYARGSADDKGQIFIHFKSVEAFLKNKGKLPLNIKMIIEGEEEIGSNNLETFIEEHCSKLQADLALISDTSMYGKGIPSVCYGLRGISYMQIEVTGPNRDLHSGSYGGSVHNPIQALAEMIAGLHDKRGRVTIPGFYESVRKLGAEERKAFKKLPWNNKEYAKNLGVRKLYGEGDFTTLERIWTRPTVECNGIWGGFISEGAKTVLPSKAYAKISMRLVPDQEAETIAKLFEKQIKKAAPRTVQVDVRYIHGGEAIVTPLKSAGVRAAAKALEKGFGKKPVYQREGGSIPIVVEFKKRLGLDTVLLGFGLPDENAHAPDEYLNLGNFYAGIRTMTHFYNELPAQMRNGKK